MSAIKRMIVNPNSGKKMKRVFVTGKGWYSWNTAFHVYNSTKNYDQLQEKERELIDFQTIYNN